MAAIGERHGVSFGSWPEGMPKDPAFFRTFGQRVERLGFELLFCGDHIFHNAPLPECLITLADMGAATSRITLGCSVVQLPMRDPSLIAKQVATLDYLSGGRFIFGAGVGGEYEREWEAVDVDRSTRGKRMDEYLDILQRLWKGEPIDFEGRFRRMHDVTLTPKPTQPGGPPIWIGGRSDAALKRAARFDGWIGYASSARRGKESADKLRQFAGGDLPPGFRTAMALFFVVEETKEKAIERAARRLGQYYAQDFTAIVESIGVVGTPDDIRERFQAYRDAGMTDFVWTPATPCDEYGEQIDQLAEILGLRGQPR